MDVQYQPDRMKITCVIRDGNELCKFYIYAYFENKLVYVHKYPIGIQYIGGMNYNVQQEILNRLSTGMYDKIELLLRNVGFFQSRKLVQM